MSKLIRKSIVPNSLKRKRSHEYSCNRKTEIIENFKTNDQNIGPDVFAGKYQTLREKVITISHLFYRRGNVP